MKTTLSALMRTTFTAALFLFSALPAQANEDDLCQHHSGDLVRTDIFNFMAQGDYQNLAQYISKAMEITDVDPETIVASLTEQLANSYDTCEFVGRKGHVTKLSVDRLCSDRFECKFILVHTAQVGENSTILTYVGNPVLARALADYGIGEYTLTLESAQETVGAD